jgi:hypothetical protein
MHNDVVAVLCFHVGQLVHELIFGLVAAGLMYGFEIHPHLFRSVTIRCVIFLAGAKMITDDFPRIFVIIPSVFCTESVSCLFGTLECAVDITVEATDIEYKKYVVAPRLPVLLVEEVVGFVFARPIFRLDADDRRRLDCRRRLD